MSWASEWKAISNRINGLKEAVQFFSQYQVPDDYNTIGKVLLPQVEEIFNLISQFQKTYKSPLSPSTQRCLNNYLSQNKIFIDSPTTLSNAVGKQKILITSLMSLQSELDFHLSDTQFIIHRITERAFVHLQRLIIVDETVKNNWNNSFKRETECEKLGAVHLLSHGIWAFKIHAKKGRTDLIYAEPVNSFDNLKLTH